MAEQWEYKAIRVTWQHEEQKWHASLPNSNQGDEKSISTLLDAWGAEGWELVNVAAESYSAADVSGGTDWGFVGTHWASQFRAFFKRRKS